MTIAERLSERHSIEFMGKRWPVLFTHDLLLALEEQTGLSVLNGDVNLFAPSAKVLCATIFLILQRAGAKCTLRSVGALLKPGRATAVVDTLAKAWRASMPKAELESEDKKSDDKPRSWMEVWGDNVRNLQLTDEQWLSYTPRMIQVLNHERLDAMRQNELMLSRIASAAANFGGSRPQKVIPEDHWMIHPYPKRKQPSGPITGEYIRSVMGGYFNACRQEAATATPGS